MTADDHGSYSTYSNHRCRCRACLDAHNEYVARRRRERAETPLPADDPRHGKPTTYQNWGCRCDRCREATTEARRAARAAARSAE